MNRNYWLTTQQILCHDDDEHLDDGNKGAQKSSQNGWRWGMKDIRLQQLTLNTKGDYHHHHTYTTVQALALSCCRGEKEMAQKQITITASENNLSSTKMHYVK